MVAAGSERNQPERPEPGQWPRVDHLLYLRIGGPWERAKVVVAGASQQSLGLAALVRSLGNRREGTFIYRSIDPRKACGGAATMRRHSHGSTPETVTASGCIPKAFQQPRQMTPGTLQFAQPYVDVFQGWRRGPMPQPPANTLVGVSYEQEWPNWRTIRPISTTLIDPSGGPRSQVLGPWDVQS